MGLHLDDNTESGSGGRDGRQREDEEKERRMKVERMKGERAEEESEEEEERRKKRIGEDGRSSQGLLFIHYQVKQHVIFTFAFSFRKVETYVTRSTTLVKNTVY